MRGDTRKRAVAATAREEFRPWRPIGWATLCAVALCGPSAFAAAPVQTSERLRDLSIEELGNIEITSVSRRPEPLSHAAAAVYVITAEDIRRSGATSLPEVLRLAPNLQVARLNAHSYTITARGFNSPESSNKILVLVDGRSVYTPAGQTVFWEQITPMLADIDRVEVISGPGGTLYGANAVNGVINVITRRASDTQGGLVDAGAGTAERNAAVRYGGALSENFAYRAYGLGFQRDRTVAVKPNDTSLDSWQGGQGGFRMDGSTGRDRYTLQGDYYANHVDNAGRRYYGQNLLGRWSRQIEAGSSVTAQTYYSDDSRFVPTLEDRLRQWDVMLQYDRVAGPHHIVSGVEQRIWDSEIQLSQTFTFIEPYRTIYVSDLFAQDEITLADDWRLTLGVKGEYYSYSGFEPLPNVRLGWQASERTFLWSAISRAVREPSRQDRELVGGGIIAASPDFRAEKLTAFEIGYRGEPFARTSVSISSYYNIYDDLRSSASANPGQTFPIVTRNGFEGHTYGVEAWASYAVADWWRLRPGAQWMNKIFHLKSGETLFPGSAASSLGQDPRYQVQLRSEMNVSDAWEFDAAVRNVGRVFPAGSSTSTVPSYVEADARLGWHVTPRLEVSLDGFNLLHARHVEVNDPSNQPERYISRTVYLNTRVRF